MNEILQFKDEYLFLSNFYPSPITWNKITFPTVEHCYQARKSNNISVWLTFSLYDTPGRAKKQGRKIDAIRKDWEEVKIEVMRECLELKFQDPILKQKLLDTGDSVLEEGNWWGDRFWGVDNKTREGRNELGNLLMELRNKLK